MTAHCYLCTGKHCGREAAFDKLVAELEDVAEVETVRCQKVCTGPVVGLEVDGRLQWFARVRKPKTRKALRRLLRAGGPVPDRLAGRRVAKRAGRLRT